MKAAAGAFIQSVQDSSTDGAPQWLRVYRTVRRGIESAALAAGARLPSARQLARDWRVSRGAVDEAFSELQQEGLIERRVGDGTYVCAPAAGTAPVLRREPTALAQQVLRHVRMANVPRARVEAAVQSARTPMLHPRAMPLDGFPLEDWRKWMLQAHDESRRSLLGGGAGAGLPALREAVTRHLALHRGVVCAAQQVLIISGPREGVTTTVRQLVGRHETVAVEDPSHPSLPLLCRLLGAQVQGVPVDAQGLNVEVLKREAGHSRLVYVHPLCQYPQGYHTSPERGQALLDWAARRQAWILEGTYNDEWVPRATQPRTLFSRDAAGRVILMNSFEGVMFPSLRVGFMVLPSALAAGFIEEHLHRGERVSLAAQWALAQFIDSGAMSEHLQRTRVALQQRRALVRAVLSAGLPPAVRCGPLDTGAQLCLHLPPAVPDIQVVLALREERLIAEAVSPTVWRDPGAAVNAIVLGYMGWEAPAVAEALHRVCKVLTRMVNATQAVPNVTKVLP